MIVYFPKSLDLYPIFGALIIIRDFLDFNVNHITHFISFSFINFKVYKIQVYLFSVLVIILFFISFY